MGVIDLTDFAEAVGTHGPVSIAGTSSRGGAVPGVRTVQAPSGVDLVQPDEMIVRCGAGTPVGELQGVLAAHGQMVALPQGGTVGGALSVGVSDVRRLGHGPVRDVLLQTRYVGADGVVVTAGGATVKNVSGFDLCRLLVGARGTLGFLGEVLLRTRPLPMCSEWFTAPCTDPNSMLTSLYRPVSILWNGNQVWTLIEGHPDDVREQARSCGLRAADGPPPLPSGSRRSVAPSAVPFLTGEFVAEVGVGIVHHAEPWVRPARDPRVVTLATTLRREFDPTGRLNPGLDV